MSDVNVAEKEDPAWLTAVSFVTTVFFFIVEALIHYNMGRSGHISLTNFPSLREFIGLSLVVLVFALWSTLTTELIRVIAERTS